MLFECRVQIRTGPLPIGTQKSVPTIRGIGTVTVSTASNAFSILAMGGEDISIGTQQFRNVVEKPEFRANLEIICDISPLGTGLPAHIPKALWPDRTNGAP